MPHRQTSDVYKLIRTWQRWLGEPVADDWAENIPANLNLLASAAQPPEPTGGYLWPKWRTWPELVYWPENIPADLDRLAASAQATDPTGQVWPKYGTGEVEFWAIPADPSIIASLFTAFEAQYKSGLYIFAEVEDYSIQPPAAAVFDPAPYADNFSTEHAWPWRSYHRDFDPDWPHLFDEDAFQCDAFQEDGFQTDFCVFIKVAASQIPDQPQLWPEWIFGPDDDQAIQPPAAPGFDPAPYVAVWDLLEAEPWKPGALGPDDDQSVQNVVQTPFDPPDAQPQKWWVAQPELVLWPENIPGNLDQLTASAAPETEEAWSWPKWVAPELVLWPENIPDNLDRLAAAAQPPIEAAPWDWGNLGPDDDQAIQTIVQAPFDAPEEMPWAKWLAYPELVLWPDEIPDNLDQLAASAQPPEQIIIWSFKVFGPDEDQSIQPPAAPGFDPAPYAGAWVEFAPPQQPKWIQLEIDDWAENIPANLDQLAGSAQFDDNIRIFAPWSTGEVVQPDRLPDDLDRIASAAQDNTVPRPWSPLRVVADDDQGIQPQAPGFDPAPYAASFDPQAAQLFRAWTGGEVNDWPTNIPTGLDRLASSSQPELLIWAWTKYRVAHDDEQPVIPILPEFVQTASEFIDPFTWRKWVTDLPPDVNPFLSLEKFLAAFELSEAYPWKKWVTDLPPDEVFKEFDPRPYASLFGIDERRLWPLWLSQPEVEPWAGLMQENEPDADETRWISARSNWGTTRTNQQTLHSGFGITRENKKTLQSGFGTVRRDEADT